MLNGWCPCQDKICLRLPVGIQKEVDLQFYIYNSTCVKSDLAPLWCGFYIQIMFSITHLAYATTKSLKDVARLQNKIGSIDFRISSFKTENEEWMTILFQLNLLWQELDQYLVDSLNFKASTANPEEEVTVKNQKMKILKPILG